MGAEPSPKPNAGPILELIGEVVGVLDRDEFAVTLIEALRTTVPSDWVSLNGISPNPQDTWAVMVPEFPLELFPAFQRLAGENPLIARLQRTQDGRAYRFSDLISQEELHALELYHEVYKPLNVEYQLAFTLPAERGHVLGVALSRGDRDFSDSERDLLNDARPFLIQAYRNVLAFENVKRRGYQDPAVVAATLTSAGLTPREAEVMQAVASGQSNQQAAEALGLSVRTVQKHLERAFAKLGVKSRTEATAKLLRPPDSDIRKTT